MSGVPPLRDDDLHAVADDCLSPERRADVDEGLAANVDAAARVAFYRRLNAGLHTAYDFMLNEPVPERLGTRPQRFSWQTLTRIAAAIGLLAAGAAGGWLARDLTDEYAHQALALADLAAEAHLVYAAEISHPVEVPASQEAQLRSWLSKSLDRPVQVPDLSAVGYEFLGGRLLPAGHGVAGQLMYQNVDGNRISLYFRSAAEERDSAFRFIPVEGVAVYYWHDQSLAYALAGELEREQLKTICNEVYRQLNPDSGPVEW
jgi:anti-sigma factor RsiW